MRRSNRGDIDALPGYSEFTFFVNSGWLLGDATTDPPTGTMKFLSVLCTMPSTRPFRQAEVIIEHICFD